MNEIEIKDKLEQIFCEVFDEEHLEISRKTCADDIEDWDSLAQINLVVAAEKLFDVKFNLSELAQLNDVGDMMDLIASKLRQ
jgi:acyl carrier protein